MPTKKNFSVRNILLATDGSEFSSGAEREAIKLATLTDASLYVISVAQVNEVLMGVAPEVTETIETRASEALKRVKERAEKEGIKVESLFHEGEEPYRFIVEEAEKRSADVIVMGRRGLRGLKKMMMGSVTALVIGHSPVPVFVVPRAGRLTFKRLLICTDGSEFSEKAKDYALGIAKRFSSKLVAISVATTEEELEEAERNVQKIKEEAEKEGLKVETVA
ncbi:MAG: universal stress protein, partial [Nitrospirae bacterium]